MPLALWLTLFFVAFNILEATQPSWISRVAPASSKGTALGIYNTLQSIGLFLGGALGGYIAKHYGAGMVNLFLQRSGRVLAACCRRHGGAGAAWSRDCDRKLINIFETRSLAWHR